MLACSDYEYQFVSDLLDSEPKKELWVDGRVSLNRFVTRIDDENVMLVFMLSKRVWFGLAHKCEKRGLVFSIHGCVREAVEKEMY